MSFDLCVWDKCNNHCRMCTNPDRPWPAFDGSFDYDFESIITRLEKKKAEISGEDVIYLTGGEPTIHPQFRDILKYLHNNFPKQTVRLLSNGRSFSYEKYAAECLALVPGLEIEMSLYGPNAEVHDAVTRAPGSFAQSLAGLKNLLKHRAPGQNIGLRFVLTRASFQSLSEFFALVEKDLMAIDRLLIIFPEYEAQALKNQNNILITYQEMREELDKVKTQILELSKKIELRLYHWSLCQLPPILWPLAWKTWPAAEVTFTAACEKCSVKKYCVGIHKGYLSAVGDKEFASVTGNLEIIESGNEYNPIIPKL